MTRRKFLTIALLLVIFIGVILGSFPFFESLKPSARSEAALPKYDMSSLNGGETIRLKHPTLGSLANGYVWSVLFYRRHDGRLLAWNIPTKGGVAGLPDFHWWRPAYKCSDFGPTKVDGVVDESLPIKCHDKPSGSNDWYLGWKWDIWGNATLMGLDDMYKTKGVENGSFFVFRKRS